MALNFLTKFLSSSLQIGVLGSLDKSSTAAATEVVLKGRQGVKINEINLPSKLIPEILIVTSAFDIPSQSLIEKYAGFVSQIPPNGAVILNWDEADCRKLAEQAQSEVIFYGTEAKKCHVWAGDIRIEQNRVVFGLNYGVERIEVRTNFVSKHQIYSLLAATAVGLRQGLRLTQIRSALETVYPLEHKLAILGGYEGSTIIDDSFDGLVPTTEVAIESLNNLVARRRIVVLGGMQEWGKLADKLYRRIAQKIAKDKIDLVLLGKGEVEIVADELLKLGFIPSRLQKNLTNPQIVGELLKVLAKGDVVLLKSAPETRFDEVIAKICKK